MPLRGFRAQVLWDRNVVELRSTEGFLGGGATAVNFRQAIPWTAEPSDLGLSFQDVLLSQVIGSVSPASERFGSRISGTVNVTFPLDDPTFATGRFSLTGVAQEEPDLSGLDFSFSGNLDQGELRLDPSRLQADDVVVTASGLYPRTGSASLSFEAEARDLSRADRLQQSLRTLLHPERPARLFGISGSGRARGALKGRLPSLVFEGDATGHEVLFRGIRWGEVEASGTFSREVVHFTSLRSQNAEGMLRGRGTFTLGGQDALAARETPPSRGILGRDFELDVELEHWPASILDPVLGLSIDLGGALTGSGTFSSKQGALVGTGHVSVTGGTFQGHDFDVASSHVAVRDRQLLLDDLAVSRETAHLGGLFHLNLDTLDVVSALNATDVPIAVLGVVPFDIEGKLGGTLRLGGRLGAATADVEADVAGLRVAGWDLGRGRVDAELRDNALRGDISLTGSGIDLEAELGIQLSRPMKLAGQARWSRADLAPLLRSTLPPTGPELPGSLRLISAGEASFAGALGSVKDLSASVSLSSLAVEVADYRLASPEPIDVELQDGELRLGSLVLVGEDTRLRIAGGANLVNGDMDLDAGGAVNLVALDALFPSMSWSGNADLAGRLHGEWARPELSGSVDLTGGAVSFRSFPQAIGDINGRVLFDNRTVRLSGIEGRFGGAPVALTGSLSLNRLVPESFDLSASGKGMRLRYPEGLVAEADADLRLTGTGETQLLSGQVDVHEATWSREYDIAAGILGSRDVLDFTEGPEESAFPDLRLDIRVNVPQNFRVRNSLAVIDGHAELQVRGTLDRPALLGRAEADQGEVFLLGQRYDILSGKVEFIDPNSIRPFFDLAAETRVRSYRV
jgi:translocation and assembly module TamB